LFYDGPGFGETLFFVREDSLDVGIVAFFSLVVGCLVGRPGVAFSLTDCFGVGLGLEVCCLSRNPFEDAGI